MTTQHSSKIAPFYQVYAGINAHDLDQAVAGYAPDVHYVERCLGWDLHSRQEVKEHFGPWFEYADMSVEMEDSFDSGDRAAVSWRFSGKVLNELAGVWPASAVGRSFSFPGVSIARITPDGLIGEVIELYNLADLLQQVGALKL